MPNDVALAAAEYAHRNKIPFVADVNDLWPEAMRMVFDIPIVSDLLFYPLKRDAEKVYSLTSGVIGTSDEYRDRPFLNQKRDVLKETVYVGNEISVFDREAEQHADEVQKEEGTFWVTYAGTIGTSYDIRTMVLAAEELMKQGKTKIRFQILGDGPTREMLENLAKERKIQNVKFTGYVPYEQMAAYLVKSDVLINSFVRKAPQSIVTKIGDYLAAGKPMINTCMSPEFRKKVEQDGFGINIEPEDVRELVNAVEWMYENEAERNDMPFEGPLFTREIVEKIGVPDKNYIILYDDSDYARRALNYTKIRYIPSAMLHKAIIPVRDKKQCMTWKDYYSYRNSIHFIHLYGESWRAKHLCPIYMAAELILRALVRRKYSNIKVILRAYRDGVHENMGKTVEPGAF